MTVRDYTIGDITADGKPDIIAIGSQQDKEANRTIYLFVNEKGNIFNLAAINENIVECEICGGAGVGDPYLRTVIKKNFFSLETVYGACTKDQVTVTFKYDKKRKWWFLHKDVTESYNCQGNEKGNIEAEVVIHSKEQYGITRFEDY